MSRGVIVSAAVATLAGAVLGVAAVLAARWWSLRHRTIDFGWYAYSPISSPRRYVDYLPTTPRTIPPDWWALLAPPAVVGGVLGLAVVLVLRLAGRRISITRVRDGRAGS